MKEQVTKKGSKTESLRSVKDILEDLSEFVDTEFREEWYFNLNVLTIDIICAECRRSKDDKMYDLLGIRQARDTWRKKIKNCTEFRPHAKTYVKDFVEAVHRKLPFITEKKMTEGLICRESINYYHTLPETLIQYAILKANYDKFIESYMGDIGKIRNLLSSMKKYYDQIERMNEKMVSEMEDAGFTDMNGYEQSEKISYEFKEASASKAKLQERYNKLLERNIELFDKKALKEEMNLCIDLLYQTIVKMIRHDYKDISIVKETRNDYQKLLHYLKFEEHHVNYDVKAYVKSGIGTIDAKDLWEAIEMLDKAGEIDERVFDNFINALDEQIAIAKAAKALWKIKHKK